MKRLHHSPQASFISERRLIAMSQQDVPKEQTNQLGNQLNQLEEQLKSSNLPPEVQKQILAGVQSARDALKKQSDPNRAANTVRKVVPMEDPRYRAAYERLAGPRNTRGLIDYLPKYHIDQAGNIVPKKIPSGATAYGLEDGVERERYDTQKGRIKFIMKDGQWEYAGVVATPEQLRTETVQLQKADAANKAAKLRHEQMLSYYLARARQGEPIPARQNMEADYAKVRYYEDLGRGRIQTDPSYNPMWTDRYKVAGQMRNSPAEIQQRKQQTDKMLAEFNARWDKIELRQKALRCMEYLSKTQNNGNFVQLPDGMGKNKQGIEFVYRNNKGVMEAYAQGNGTWAYDGKEGTWKRTGDLPDDLGVEKAQSVAAAPQQSNASTNAVPTKGVADSVSAESAYDKDAGTKTVAGKVADFFKGMRPTQAAASEASAGAPTEKVDVPEVELKKIAEAKKLPSGQWGDIASGEFDGKDKTSKFMYRISNNVLQAYSPKAGLYEFNEKTGKWFVPGDGRPRQYVDANDAYAAIFPKKNEAPSSSGKPAETSKPTFTPEKLAAVAREQAVLVSEVTDPNLKIQDRVKAMDLLAQRLKEFGMYLNMDEIGAITTLSDNKEELKNEDAAKQIESLAATIGEKVEVEATARLASVRNSLLDFLAGKGNETGVVMNMHDLVQYTIEFEKGKRIKEQKEMDDYMLEHFKDKDELFSKFHAMTETSLKAMPKEDVQDMIENINVVLQG